MIKLKNILLEGRSIPIQIEDVNKLITKYNIDLNFINENKIFRGTDSSAEKFMLVKPSKHSRKSAHTSNAYTVFIDNSPAWKNYPKRSESIICTTRYAKARTYGKVYIVIPLEKDAKIAICSDNDIWNSFKRAHIGSLGDFNEDLNMIATELFDSDRYAIEEDGNITYESLLYLFKQIDEHKYEIKRLIDEDELILWNDVFWDIYLKSNIPFKAYLNKRLSPKYNNFFIDEYYNGYAIKNLENNEVWTDESCLLIRYDVFEDLLSAQAPKIVTESSKKQIKVYHATNADTISNIDYSKLSQHSLLSGFGLHFGTKKAAEHIQKKKNLNDIHVYLLDTTHIAAINKPVKEEEFAFLLYKQSRKLNHPNLPDFELFKSSPLGVLTDYYKNNKELYKQAVAESIQYLKNMGFTGVAYMNKTEDAGSVSYVVFDFNTLKRITDEI